VDLTNENVAFTGDLIEFNIGQFAPLLLHLTPELLPVTPNLIPSRLFLFSVCDGCLGFPESQGFISSAALCVAVVAKPCTRAYKRKCDHPAEKQD
jgi:hypothetical protein